MNATSNAKATGRRLKRLRLARRMTQRDLSEPKYTAAYVSTIEAGKRNPSSTAIAHFASQLGVDPAEIVTGRPKDFVAELQLKLSDAAVKMAGGDLRAAEQVLEEIEQGARKFDLRIYEAKARQGRGLLAERRGKIDAAFSHYEAADEMLADEPAPARAEVVAGIARCHQLRGKPRYATHLLETYLISLEDQHLEDPLALMRTYSSLIWPYSELGLFERADQAASKALSLESRVDDPEQLANMHLNVARELLRRGRSDEALESLKRAQEFYESLQWRSEIARADLARGIVLAAKKKYGPALAALDAAVETLAETGSVVNHARALTERARVRRLTSDSAAAAKDLERAIALLGGGGGEVALSFRELALCEADDHPRRAEKHLRAAIDLFDAAGDKEQLAVTYRELGDLLSRRGSSDSGRQAYREGLLLFNH